ncbi:unnamed protein product [Tetraodon nigroviridis]|uniref:Chromosome 11 SCAF14674, whole genome shotgun sequence n=1 Tax=Tetraodon nigroviridis TaxID=99883 RepID=Q4SBE2_TETNG|nr:unnamed protein product [Tetraodon nigroviridis]
METYTRQGITEHILTRFVTPLPLDWGNFMVLNWY